MSEMLTTSGEKAQRGRILIAYATKGGSTAVIARWLAEGMTGAGVDVLDVGDIQSLDYDFVVLGAPVRLGKIHPAMVAFLEEHRQKLSQIPKALFVVCLFTLLGRRYLRKMKAHVDGEIAAYRVFGGKLGILNMLDREYAAEVGRTIWQEAST